MMKKVLLYGILPLTVVGVSYYLYTNRKPSIENVDWLSDSELTVNVDGKINKIAFGECLMMRGYSICALRNESNNEKTLSLKNKNGVEILHLIG